MFRDMTDEQLADMHKLTDVRVGQDNALALYATVMMRLMKYQIADEMARRVADENKRALKPATKGL